MKCLVALKATDDEHSTHTDNLKSRKVSSTHMYCGAHQESTVSWTEKTCESFSAIVPNPTRREFRDCRLTYHHTGSGCDFYTRPAAASAGSGLVASPATRRTASLYLGDIWICEPQKPHMKRLLDLLLVAGMVRCRPPTI